jgi:hypothetical protein
MRDGKRGLVIKALTKVLNMLSTKWEYLTKPPAYTVQW